MDASCGCWVGVSGSGPPDGGRGAPPCGRVSCKQQGICRGRMPPRWGAAILKCGPASAVLQTKRPPEGGPRALSCAHANARRLGARRSGNATCALKNRSRAGPRSARNSDCGFSPIPRYSSAQGLSSLRSDRSRGKTRRRDSDRARSGPRGLDSKTRSCFLKSGGDTFGREPQERRKDALLFAHRPERCIGSPMRRGCA